MDDSRVHALMSDTLRLNTSIAICILMLRRDLFDDDTASVASKKAQSQKAPFAVCSHDHYDFHHCDHLK